MAFVIKKQEAKGAVWLVSTGYLRWGEQEAAIQFNNPNEARRIAKAIGVTGDWSINVAAADPIIDPRFR